MSIVNDNMSDTPETDAHYRQRIDDYHNGFESYSVIRDSDFARQLERERDEARENCKSIVDKANELIARWDQPSWKDTAPTAKFINAMRIAVEAYEKKKP